MNFQVGSKLTTQRARQKKTWKNAAESRIAEIKDHGLTQSISKPMVQAHQQSGSREVKCDDVESLPCAWKLCQSWYDRICGETDTLNKNKRCT